MTELQIFYVFYPGGFYMETMYNVCCLSYPDYKGKVKPVILNTTKSLENAERIRDAYIRRSIIDPTIGYDFKVIPVAVESEDNIDKIVEEITMPKDIYVFATVYNRNSSECNHGISAFCSTADSYVKRIVKNKLPKVEYFDKGVNDLYCAFVEFGISGLAADSFMRVSKNNMGQYSEFLYYIKYRVNQLTNEKFSITYVCIKRLEDIHHMYTRKDW